MEMKWLALLLGWMFTTTAWTQNPSQTFTEVNLGVATLTGYTEDVFPGGSVLLGMTRQPSDNFVVEFQAGVAFPTVATAKVGNLLGHSHFLFRINFGHKKRRPNASFI